MVAVVAIMPFVSDLRAVNARLRQVVADKDELVTAQQALIALQREQVGAQDALIKAQTMQLSCQADQIEAQTELIRRLEDEKVELRRQLGASST